MKFSCDTCHARYTIADEKVRGKILRVRCKKCGSSIVLKEPEDEPVEQVAVREDDATHVLRTDEIKRVLTSPEAVTVPAAKFVSRHSQPAEAVPPPPPREKAEWYVLVQKEEVGPLRMDELRERAAAGKLTPRTYIWRDGMANWSRVQTVPELADILALIPENLRRPTSPPPPPPLTSAVFAQTATQVPAPIATQPTPTPAMVPLLSVVPSAPAEVTPKDPFEKTILATASETRLVPAPRVDPSTLLTEVPTPSQERTIPFQDLAPSAVEPAAVPDEAPTEETPAAEGELESHPPPVSLAEPPPEEPPEEEAVPALFARDRPQVPVLAEAFRTPASDEAARASLPFETTGGFHGTDAAPLPSVLVDLGASDDVRQTVRALSTEMPGADAAERPVSSISLADERPPPAHKPDPERSASFVQALRPRPWRRVATLALPIALIGIAGAVYWMFGIEAPRPPRPQMTMPDISVPAPAPVPAKKDPPKPHTRTSPAPSPSAPAATERTSARMSDEQAAFAAVQNDKAERRLNVAPADFLHHDEQELNHDVVTAEVDEELLSRKVKQVSTAIEHCVTAETHHNENFHVGKLKVNITLAATGAVTEVSFDKKAVTDGSLGDCLRLAFKAIKMPPHEGEAQHVEIPLQLP